MSEAQREPGLLGGRVTVDLGGSVGVVTGGTRGVGAAIAAALADAGAAVVVCGRHAPEPSALPEGVQFSEADVRDPDHARRLVDEVVERFGRLDLLVNNAGGSPYVLAAEASPRFVSSIVTLNLLAPMYCAQAAFGPMSEQAEGGVIVNIGSVSGMRATPGTAAYGAAKAGLINLTRTLAVEWAPRVRVNCVTAGLLDTGAGAEHYGGEAGLARVAATIPLGRMGVAADVAGACLFLASPWASYVSGANLVVDGGGEWPAYLTAAGSQAP